MSFLNNKYVSWTINIAYFIGLIWSIETGYYGIYFLITTLMMIIVFWKPLIATMKLGANLYTEWSMKTAKNTIGKYNPYISDKERMERQNEKDKIKKTSI